jgi:hypothetical protein
LSNLSFMVVGHSSNRDAQKAATLFIRLA